jgi:hypothetical protein
MDLQQVACEISTRLNRLFLADEHGRRPCHGSDPRFASDPYWRELPLFYEYFDGDNGRGVGASHQTGWTALVARLLDEVGRRHRVCKGASLGAPPTGDGSAASTRSNAAARA